MPGKRVQFDDETWAAVDLLSKDSMRDFQELADEAFRDLLSKHGRPVDLKDQLRKSVRSVSNEDTGAARVPPRKARQTSPSRRRSPASRPR